MTPEKYKTAGELFHRLRHLPECDRESALNIACKGDGELRDEIISLLEGDEEAGDSFLGNPAMEDAANLLGLPQSVPQYEEIAIPELLVGRYRMGQRIGAGGMGVVYQAEDLRLLRRVAVKILPVSVTGRATERTLRFQREARAASQLNHPNIAAVHDSGTEAGLSFMVMEFVEGRTLRSMLWVGTRPAPRTVLDVVSQTASALRAAHEAGIIHRDIKPENIMLRPDGFLKVLDFGLARITDPASNEAGASLLTRAGQVAGTVQYLSPEQVLGKKVTPQTDLFSLGVVAYEFASGVRPFDGPTDGAIFEAILHRDPPPPSALRPELGTALDALILGALEKDPDLRFQTAAELCSACKRCERLLAASAGSHPQTYAPPIRSKQGARRRSFWTGIAAAVLVMSVALYLSRPMPEPHVTRNVQVTTGGPVAAFVNDGTRLYYSAAIADSSFAFFEISAKGGSARELTNFRGMAPLDISADHTEILLGELNKGSPFPLWVGPVFGSDPRRLGDLRAVYAHWSSRGDKIVYTTGKDVRLANVDGSGGRILFDRIEGDGHITAPSFFDDDRRIRFQTSQNNVDKIWDMNADGTGLHPVLPVWDDAGLQADPAMAANGRYMVFVAGKNAIDWDLWFHRENNGIFGFRRPKPVRLTEGPLSITHPEFAPDGRRIFYLGDTGQTQLVRLEQGSGEWRPYLGGMNAFQLDFSRDGLWMTYVAPPGHSVWCSRSDGSRARQLTMPPLNGVNPRFSPDGSKVVFFGDQPGQETGMFLVPSSGGLVTTLKPNTTGHSIEEPSWSLENRKILYGDSRSLWIIDIGTHKVEGLPGSEGLHFPRWSPDGKYAAAEDEESHLWLYSIADHRRILLTKLGAGYPTWSRDSRYVYFENNVCSSWYRVGIEDHRVEQVSSLATLHMPAGSLGWVGLALDGSVISSRDVSTRNIYAIDWQMR
ncbi:MAG: serine/threonine-protein kinase [Acidobacteriaceae bacterium]|nr:serine/threonine-protein kinase [Acidobacteriaceae bacterium]